MAYNPLTDNYYGDDLGKQEAIRTNPAEQFEIEQRRVAAAQERDTNLKYNADRYSNQMDRIANAERNAEIDFMLEREREKQIYDLADKQQHIREAKARYNNLSPFKKLFTRKIDSFKEGFGYHKSSEMSIEQIDDLYQGKSR